ncbi:hypothetical protein D3C87_1238670 [compost metagenome]
MNSQESAFHKKEIVLMSVLAVLAMALLTVAIIPSLRNSVKEIFSSSERIILAKVSGNITAEGPKVTVLKIRSKDTLALEVYSDDPGQENTLIAKIPLFETKDAFFVVNGNATNLALTDVDKDETMEIVAPTYNEQMVPRLNIFKYNRASKSFDRVNAPEEVTPE